MHKNKTHKVFLLDPESGEAVGVVSLMDVARELVGREGREKVQLNDMSVARAAADVVVRNSLSGQGKAK
jgi:CBS domain containing-hemolysin-like protein